jgi:predicted DCC family thiol-disulfide oxidoreductase YuxK
LLKVMRKHRLIYDDSCPVCLAAMRKVARLDTDKAVEWVPLSAASLQDLPEGLTDRALRKQIHLVSPEGDVTGGSDAVAKLAQLFGETRTAGRLLLLPVIRPIARVVYSLVARLRYPLSRLPGLHKPPKAPIL